MNYKTLIMDMLKWGEECILELIKYVGGAMSGAIGGDSKGDTVHTLQPFLGPNFALKHVI